MELKKPHPSRLVGGAKMQMWNRLVPHPRVVDKNSGGKSQGAPGITAPYQAPKPRKIRSYNFWQQKPVGIELVEETFGVPSSSP